MYGGYPQGQFQSMQYQQPQNQFNQMQQNNRLVEGYEQVKYAEVPADGSAYYFYKADGSEIYSKKWLPNCTTDVKVYKLCVEDEAKSNPFEDMTNAILDKLNSLDERLQKIEKSFLGRNNTAKKEEVK